MVCSDTIWYEIIWIELCDRLGSNISCSTDLDGNIEMKPGFNNLVLWQPESSVDELDIQSLGLAFRRDLGPGLISCQYRPLERSKLTHHLRTILPHNRLQSRHLLLGG